MNNRSQFIKGKTALVAGATRGAGRGIALALAEAGARVFCTGRSTAANRANTAQGPFDLAGRPETVEETARLCGGEAMLQHFGITEASWREGAKKDPNFAHSESPQFVGRAVAALAADPEVSKKGGRVFASWTLAKEYGFTDADGRTPDWGAHFAEIEAHL